jgi:hypothetical protein
METFFVAWFIAGWLAFGWIGYKMARAGWKAGERWSLLFNATSFLLADYNRRNFRILVTCFIFMVAAIIAFNVLFLTGQISP